MKLNLALSNLTCCICLCIVAGLNPTLSYNKGPIILTEKATLFYEVSPIDDMARFALIINDTSVLSDGAAWVGIGIGEPTSGSMIGADIVTAEFKSGVMDSCSIVDRYVPFVAYPWDEAPSIFPIPDDCSEPDWSLISCQRDMSGVAVLEISRSLSVKDDKQDRAILPGNSNVLYAYGGQFGYHGSNRHSESITLYREEEDDDEDMNNDENGLPSDVDGSFELRATNYRIPAKTTTYACTTRRMPLQTDQRYMIIGAEPLLSNTTGSMVHHFTLYLCKGEEYYRQTKNTTVCEGNPFLGPVANRNASCSTLVLVYAKGTSRVLYPENVGILVDGSRPFLTMETHFNNADGLSDAVDSSGIKIYYTNTIRQNQAGSLMLGDAIVSREPDVIQSGFRYQHTCPSECTSRFPKPINIFASFLHMHTTGKQIYDNIYDENNTFVKTLNKRMEIFEEPVVLQPGQQMQTVCEYDTSKRPETRFGSATKDEMCVEFLMYWPVQTDPKTGHEFNICSFGSLGGGDSTTLCGDHGRLAEMFSEENASDFPFVENPVFNDTEGAPTNFGASDSACPTEEGAVEMPSPTMTGAPDSIESDTSESLSCFPAKSMVKLKTGRSVLMKHLRVGDEVLVGQNTFSTVFMFTHSDKTAKATFLRLETASNHSITLSEGHFLFVNGQARPAEDIQVGNMIHLASGSMSPVVKVHKVKDIGLYNPQTLHGNIVVDDITCTTFTKAVYPITAVSLLAPLRFIYRQMELDFSF